MAFVFSQLRLEKGGYADDKKKLLKLPPKVVRTPSPVGDGSTAVGSSIGGDFGEYPPYVTLDEEELTPEKNTMFVVHEKKYGVGGRVKRRVQKSLKAMKLHILKRMSKRKHGEIKHIEMDADESFVSLENVQNLERALKKQKLASSGLRSKFQQWAGGSTKKREACPSIVDSGPEPGEELIMEELGEELIMEEPVEELIMEGFDEMEDKTGATFAQFVPMECWSFGSDGKISI